MERECDHLLSFIADELDQEDNQIFKEHLLSCPECSKEYESMTEIWHSLYLDIEEQEVPPSLKEEVMDFVFNKEETEERRFIKTKRRSWPFWRPFSPAAAVLVLLLTVVSLILAFSNMQLKNKLIESSHANIEVLSAFSLQSTESGSEKRHADGSAFVLQKGAGQSLVVQLHDLQPLQGSEVYQVWLLKNGERENAGGFKPDKNGSGLLTYNFPDKTDFDQIGITIEPDPYSIEPRGKKVLGSS